MPWWPTAAKIEGAIAKTGQGVEINRKVAAALNEIVTKVRQVDELVAAVAVASREQTQGILQINTAVGEMDKVTQSNAASAEQSAAAAQELGAQVLAMEQSAVELLHLVGGHREEVKAASQGTARGDAKALARSHSQTPPPPANRPSQVAVLAGRGSGEIPMAGDFKNF